MRATGDRNAVFWRALVTLTLAGALLAGPAGGTGTAAAQVQLGTYGMPHEAVWGLLFDAFCQKHNCTHVDSDMSSAEAITKFLAERGKPVACATEAGRAFGPVAVKRGAALLYKNAN